MLSFIKTYQKDLRSYLLLNIALFFTSLFWSFLAIFAIHLPLSFNGELALLLMALTLLFPILVPGLTVPQNLSQLARVSLSSLFAFLWILGFKLVNLKLVFLGKNLSSGSAWVILFVSSILTSGGVAFFKRNPLRKEHF